MPIVTIQITREGVTSQQKDALIKGATDLLVQILDKDPATTFVLIHQVDVEDWGVAGKSVSERRPQPKRKQLT